MYDAGDVDGEDDAPLKEEDVAAAMKLKADHDSLQVPSAEQDFAKRQSSTELGIVDSIRALDHKAHPGGEAGPLQNSMLPVPAPHKLVIDQGHTAEADHRAPVLDKPAIPATAAMQGELHQRPIPEPSDSARRAEHGMCRSSCRSCETSSCSLM